MTTRAKKSLGQNFLRDETVVERIVDALRLAEADTVIEIGPGTGALTRRLAGRTRRLIAIEFDRDLIPALEREFSGPAGVEIMNADALDLDLGSLGNEQFKIVANLPYNVATPILQRLAAQRGQIDAMVLMFQREVVERITAQPGGKQRGYLSILAQNAFAIERLFDVPPSAFSPVPKVWSSVARFCPMPIAPEEPRYLRLASTAFAQKRKTILNNLKREYPNALSALNDAAIDPSRRAETLTQEEWRSLFGSIEKTARRGMLRQSE
jgi:16S rRNA (adenine1518-N6/adenine1519-N6)-dimethyltransferase